MTVSSAKISDEASRLKISIVTISFNQARFLRACIESVLAQSYAEFEYIVVDPGSSDGSREIIEQYGDKIDTIIFDPDDGPADGLNKGFSRATGQILFYLNADDCLVPGSFRRASEIFEKNTACDILIGRGYQIDERGAIVRTLFPSKVWTTYRYAIGVANAVQQATYFRRSAFLASGGFNCANRTCWDGELLVDMVSAGARVCSTSQVLGCFRIYPDSISGSGRMIDAYLRDQERIRQKSLVDERGHVERIPAWLIRLGARLVDPERLMEDGWYWSRRAVSYLRAGR